jgi:hypothetical protein
MALTLDAVQLAVIAAMIAVTELVVAVVLN